MAKNTFHTLTIPVVLGYLFLCSCNSSLTPEPINGSVDLGIKDEPEMVHLVQGNKTETSEDKRKKLQSIYRSFIGVREKTGNNDGKEVEMFLAHEGLDKGYAWCSAFVGFCLDSAEVENTVTAWSPTAENKKNIVYYKGKLNRQPLPGDVHTLYYSSKKRIGHTGFFDYMVDDDLTANVEGNTNGAKSREGDGVYLVFRPIGTLHSISSWIK